MEIGDRIIDALDLETLILAEDQGDARRIMQGFLGSMGFSDHDIVFSEQVGPVVRVRARAYLHRPGSAYNWLVKGGG